MSRPIWSGNISFGLVNIPVNLYSAENAQSDLHFHLLDQRNHARIRYERINEETGKKVPWDQIVKAYEFEKGNYVIINDTELQKTAAEHSQMVEIQDFVEQKFLSPLYFEKSYYLAPTKQGQKGYVLLRETLARTKKAGIVKVVIKTKQHLAALLPHQNTLLLCLLHFAKEVRGPEEFEIPKENLKSYKVSPKEIEMAEKLVESMTSKWDPKQYHDENRELLSKWINNKIKRRKSVTAKTMSERVKPQKAQVVDFMKLLKQSIEKKHKRKSH